MLPHIHIYTLVEIASRAIHCFWLSPTLYKAEPLNSQHAMSSVRYIKFIFLLHSPSCCPCPCLFCLFSHLELQQRACEYLVLPTVGQEIMETVMNSMPPYLDKGNALMNMHEVSSCFPTLPYPTLRPYPTLPYLTLPYPTLPYPNLPTLPYPTLAYLALPYPTAPCPTLPHPSLPYPTLLYLDIPCPTILP